MIVLHQLVGTVLGPMGTTDRIHLSTIPQVNEGNIKDMLVSKNVSDDVKQMITTYLIQQKAPPIVPAAVKTIGAAASSGNNSNEIEPIVSRNR